MSRHQDLLDRYRTVATEIGENGKKPDWVSGDDPLRCLGKLMSTFGEALESGDLEAVTHLASQLQFIEGLLPHRGDFPRSDLIASFAEYMRNFVTSRAWIEASTVDLSKATHSTPPVRTVSS